MPTRKSRASESFLIKMQRIDTIHPVLRYEQQQPGWALGAVRIITRRIQGIKMERRFFAACMMTQLTLNIVLPKKQGGVKVVVWKTTVHQLGRFCPLAPAALQTQEGRRGGPLAAIPVMMPLYDVKLAARPDLLKLKAALLEEHLQASEENLQASERHLQALSEEELLELWRDLDGC